MASVRSFSLWKDWHWLWKPISNCIQYLHSRKFVTRVAQHHGFTAHKPTHCTGKNTLWDPGFIWWSDNSTGFSYHRPSSTIMDYHLPFDHGLTFTRKFCMHDVHFAILLLVLAVSEFYKPLEKRNVTLCPYTIERLICLKLNLTLLLKLIHSSSQLLCNIHVSWIKLNWIDVTNISNTHSTVHTFPQVIHSLIKHSLEDETTNNYGHNKCGRSAKQRVVKCSSNTHLPEFYRKGYTGSTFLANNMASAKAFARADGVVAAPKDWWDMLRHLGAILPKRTIEERILLCFHAILLS